MSLQLKVSQHLKGDLLKELDDECRHLSVRKTRDAFTGQDIPYGWWPVQRVTQVAPEMGQFLDQGQSVMDDFIYRFGYPRRVLRDEIQNFLVSEFPLVTQLDWALNCLSVRLPMLFPRLQKSGKNGISTFLRSPLHWEYQRMTKGTPLGVIVRQGTEITYWRNESRTYIGITYWLFFFCQGQREVLGGVEGNRETNPRRMSTMHIATLV